MRPKNEKSTVSSTAICWLLVLQLVSVDPALAGLPACCSTPATSNAQEPASGRHGLVAAATIGPAKELPGDPTDSELTCARVFFERLVPLNATPVAGENSALAKAIKLFADRRDSDDVSALTDFVFSYRTSRWCASLEYNLGENRFAIGRLSEALRLWHSAWDRAKVDKGHDQSWMATAALASLLELDARLGRQQEIESMLPQLAGRPAYGAVAVKLDGVRLGMSKMRAEPQDSFKCGPYAVSAILKHEKQVHDHKDAVLRTNSTRQGNNLAQVKHLADQVGLHYQMAMRSKGAPVIVPAIMHWKVDHFAAITGKKESFFQLEDRTFDSAGNRLISLSTLELESDGYFLVPDGALPAGWRRVDDREAINVWGKGTAHNKKQRAKTKWVPKLQLPANLPAAANPFGNGSPSPCSRRSGMAQGAIFAAQVTHNITDTPLSYSTPIGPAMEFEVNYNDLETGPSTASNFTNLGPNWSFNWVSYLNVTASSKDVTVYVRGGGSEVFKNQSLPSTPAYLPDIFSQARLISVVDGASYQRQLPDGSVEVFNQSDGAATDPKIFMTQVIDPQGNSAFIQYDNSMRVIRITDALGQVTMISYVGSQAGNQDYFKIAQIVDPFGRKASFQYDVSTTNLLSITDAIDLTSSFIYRGGTDDASFITAMTTPYGTTSFYPYIPPKGLQQADANGLRVTFPDGTYTVTECWLGFSVQTYTWSREQTMLYPFDPGNNDYTHCTTMHWLVDCDESGQVPVMDKVTRPLESAQITYRYPGQSDQISSPEPGYPSHACINRQGHTINTPTEVTQESTWNFQYNSIGRVLQAVDPLKRRFDFAFADNQIDLTKADFTRHDAASPELVGVMGQWLYNKLTTSPAPTTPALQHLPLVVADGSGQRTVCAYNEFGQAAQISDAAGNLWTLTYGPAAAVSAAAYLQEIDGPLAGNSDVVRFSYDEVGRVSAITDSAGYEVRFSFDKGDRVTQISYPDGTNEQFVYDKLDLVQYKDTLGRWTQYLFDSMDQLVSVTDPLGRSTQYGWCACGALSCMRDAAGNRTTWHHDIAERLVEKTYPDGRQEKYAYDSAKGFLASKTDALNQTKAYFRNSDRSIAKVEYANAANPTSPVGLRYDPLYPRLVTSQNDKAFLSFGYNPFQLVPDSIGSVVLQGAAVAGNTVTISIASTGATNVEFTGNPSGSGDYVNVLVVSDALVASAGKRNINVQLATTDTSTDALAAHVANAMSNDQILTNAGITATSAGSVVSVKALSAAGALSLSANSNGTVTETVTGEIRVGDVASITVCDSGIPADEPNKKPLGTRTYTHVVTGSDSTSTIAQQLCNQVSADTDLSSRGITASCVPGTSSFTVKSTSANPTHFRQSVLPADKLAINLSGGPSETGRVRILPTSPIQLTYTVQATDTDLLILAASIKNAINADPAFTNAGITATNAGSTKCGIVHLSAPLQLGAAKLAISTDGAPSPSVEAANVVATINVLKAAAAGDTINMVFFNGVLSGGKQVLQQAVTSNDTAALATDLAAKINGDTLVLGAAKIVAAAAGHVVTITAPASTGLVNVVTSVNGIVIETISGTATAGDIVTITAFNPVLPSGSATVSHSVTGSEPMSAVAADLANKINADMAVANISAIAGASGSDGLVTIDCSSPNETLFSQSVTGARSEQINQSGGPVELLYTGEPRGSGSVGAVTNSAWENAITAYSHDVLGRTINRSINGSANSTSWVYDSISRVKTESNTLGAFNFTYVDDQPGSSKGISRLSSIAYPNGQTTNFTWLPNIGDQRLQQIVNLDPSAALLSQFNYAFNAAGEITQWQQKQNAGNIHQSPGYDLAGQLIACPIDSGSVFRVYISGTANAGDTVSVTAYDASLTGTTPVGQETASYPVVAGDTPSLIAAELANRMNSVMSNINISALASGSAISVTTSPNHATQFSCEATGAATIIALGQSSPVPGLHKQLYYSYDCASNRIGLQGDSSGSFPAGLTTSALKHSFNNLNQLLSIGAGGPIAFKATTNETIKSARLDVSNTAGGSAMNARLSSSTAFSATPMLAEGPNTVAITAISGGGTSGTTNYPVTISSANSQSFQYDANGNMTSDGTNSIAWDAENRPAQITYPGPGNTAELGYDSVGRCSQIVGKSGGAITSTLNFIWGGADRCEVRDESNNLLGQYFALGQMNFGGGSGTKYFYTKDHLGSIREVTNTSGAIQSQFAYSPWGEPTQIAGSGATPDFGFSGMYRHDRSGLNLTLFRAYNPGIGRWLSRDPLGEGSDATRYSYCWNDPINGIDPLGLEYIRALTSPAFGTPLIHSGAVVNIDGSFYTINGYFAPDLRVGVRLAVDIRRSTTEPNPPNVHPGWPGAYAGTACVSHERAAKFVNDAYKLQAKLRDNPIQYTPWPGVTGPGNAGTSNQVLYELAPDLDLGIRGVSPGYNLAPQGLPSPQSPSGTIWNYFSK